MESTSSSPTPPAAKKRPHKTEIHGHSVVDDYYWLRERDNPEVRAYLEAENAYTEEVMAPAKELQEQLYKELLGRIKETDLDVPVRDGPHFYYSRTEKGKQYRIHCRKPGSLDAQEQLLLDENALAEGFEFFDLGLIETSPDHRLLAYASDTDGSETYVIRVKNLETGELFDDRIENAGDTLEWAADSRTFFYSTLDDTKRPYRLWRHRLGESEDELLLEEPDPAFYLTVDKTNSKRFLIAELKSNVACEVRVLEADRPDGEFRLIREREGEIEYYIEHHGDRFLIHTNENARDFRVVSAPTESPGKENWRDFLPHRDGVLVESVEPYENHLVVVERTDGLRRIRLSDPSGGNVRYVDFQDPAYAVWTHWNPEFDSDTLRFTYESLTTPESVYDYDMRTGKRELKKRYEVLGGYDPEEYQSERLFATAPDGERAPVSLVYRKGLAKDGRSPALLYGYGAYGYSIDPTFSSNRLSLLDRGFVFAVAHIRGGEDMGRRWYDDGKLLKKRNTFTDFIAAGELLVREGFTSPGKLAIYGGSAGGLLVGAVLNLRPELFGAAIAVVPFVDVVNTMLDETIPLTVTEYEEWGNPNEKEYFDYIRSYSPYDNIEAKAYPHILVTAGLNDPRVQYWEPAKYVAKLRAVKKDDSLLLLKTKMTAGHGGPSGRYEKLRETAFQYAFLLRALAV